MTQREFYIAIINANISDELTDYAKGAITKLDERNAKKSSTITPKQKENFELMSQIYEHVAQFEKGRTASEVAEAMGITTSKASALLRKLWDNGEMTREEIKVKGKGKVQCYKAAERTEEPETTDE